MKIVEVTWHDAHQSGDEGMKLDDFHKPYVVTSIGYLERRDKTGITIAGCLDQDEHFDRKLFVPAAMIRKVRCLR